MVKVANNKIPQLLKALDAVTTCVLVYGPDEGLVREKAKTIAKQVVDDLQDPFNVVRPDLSALSDNPSLLGDEMAALSMMGGRRLVWLDGATDKALTPCEIALSVENTDNLLIVTAGTLQKKSKLRALFENSPNAVSLPFYGDTSKDIEGVIFEVLNSYGLRAEATAISYLLSALGNDRSVTRGEIEKLALYKINDENKEITLEDAKAIIGDNNTLTLNEIANAVASGEPQKLDNLLERAITQGENPIAILRVLQKHLQKLHFIKGQMDEGLNADTAMGKLYPRLFFKEKDTFKAQLYKWNVPKLGQAMNICQNAERECKTTGMPDQAICARTCLSLSVRAAQSRR
ncbi:MAG: DNA polymerase III subunit delta [Sphingomonadales bacterium]|nr:DNA polymerase III subunit delta [Sphingomonadales bacterium]